MRTIGIRAAPTVVTFAVYNSIKDEIINVEDILIPKAFKQAARMAAVDLDIEAMHMGYRSRIGDMGSALSGGQKQRILLARALYKRPRILLLDEATSHLDVEREHEVNRSIRGLRVTRIIVAHRRETIAMADRVVVLAGGRPANQNFIADEHAGGLKVEEKAASIC